MANKERVPLKSGRYVVNVSFKADEKDLLDYADSNGSFSDYVKRLIVEDMKKEKSPSQNFDMTDGMKYFFDMMLLQMQKGVGSKDGQDDNREQTKANVNAVNNVIGKFKSNSVGKKG